MVTFKSKTRKPQGWYLSHVNTIPPPILFKQSLWNKDAEDAETTAFKLHSNPTDKDSQLYELRARSFTNGTPEQFILWKREIWTKSSRVRMSQDSLTSTKWLEEYSMEML
jgi:hypothetical protein